MLFFNQIIMKLFDSPLANRIGAWKLVGFIIWLVWFFFSPLVFYSSESYISYWILLWYTTLWAFIWVMWIIDKYPILNIPFPFWIRWTILWAWMNFVLVLFFQQFIETTTYEWYSIFYLIIEWAIIWLIIDFCITKWFWEWNKLINK